MGFPGNSADKESTCNAEDPSSVPVLGRSTGEGIGYQLQYSWTFLVAQLVKNPPAMWETWFDLWVGKTPWRRERLPIPVFWPGEFHGLYSPWGHKESDTTEWLSLTSHQVVAECKNFPIICHISAVFFPLERQPKGKRTNGNITTGIVVWIQIPDLPFTVCRLWIKWANFSKYPFCCFHL